MSRALPPEVLFADAFNRPVFQMGPYDSEALARNTALADAAEGAETDWGEWFGGAANFTLTVNGREAIDLALADLRLGAGDEVLIITTSGSPYISNCVTSAIERRCAWGREPGVRTRAIMLIHEFGFPARLSPELLALGLPIVEDCAYAMGTSPADGSTGTYGDYVIWSFSKAFPMPFGGLLKSPAPLSCVSAISREAAHYAPIVAAAYLREAQAAFAKRRDLFEIYRDTFARGGFRPLFEPEAGTVPHAFLVAMDDQPRAEVMKPQLQSAGVISSVFYGGGGYFLPNHQGMDRSSVDYIFAHFEKAFIEAGRVSGAHG